MLTYISPHSDVNDQNPLSIFSQYPDIFHTTTSDYHQVIAHPGLVVIPMLSYAVSNFLTWQDDIGLSTAEYLEHPLSVFLERQQQARETALIIDSSCEGNCYDTGSTDQLWQIFNRFGLDPQRNCLFIHNKCLDKQRINQPQIGQNISIDFHAVMAYYRTQVSKQQQVSLLPLAQREPRLCLLIGKLKTKLSRFITAYSFYKHDLLKDSVLGIHCELQDLLDWQQRLPEFQDPDFISAIEPYLGAADSVSEQHNTNEGLTANAGGWPFDPAIFTTSRVSYCCESYDFDKPGDQPLITEKTYRAIINRHAFVIQSTPGKLNILKDMGYRTFDSLIDETYNLCSKQGQHVNETVRAAKLLLQATTTNQDLVQEIVDHNWQLWCETAAREYEMTADYMTAFFDSLKS